MTKRSAVAAAAVPALALLRESTLQETCRSMLETALPLALGMPKAKRHRHQATVVSMFEGVASDTESKRSRALEQIESQIARANEEKEKCAEVLREAQALCTQQKAICREKELLQRSANEEVAKTKGALAQQKAHLDTLGAKQAEVVARSAEFEEVQKEVLQPLKVDQESPNKAKLVSDLVNWLRENSVEESLAVAITFAFNTKPEERSEFLNTAVRMVDDVLLARAIELSEELGRISGEMASQGEQIAVAEAALISAEGNLSECLNVVCSEENALLTAETARIEADNALKELTPQMKSLQLMLEHERNNVRQVQELRAQFGKLEDCSSSEVHDEGAQTKIAAMDTVPEIASANTAILGGA